MNFLVKTLLKKQLKGVPEEQIDMIIAAMEKNPAFFQTLAEEIKAKIATGVSERDAALEIMGAHTEELKKIMGK